MSSSKLPTLRLASQSDEHPTLDDIDPDFMPSSASKFGFAWPTEDPQNPEHMPQETPLPSHLELPSAPRLSRAFSMPLPSQIGHWQHPCRSPSGTQTPPTPPLDQYSSSTEQHFKDLALELADSVQMAIQTLLQLSPPHLFDPAKEQFSACAVQIPTPSISALLTSMKNLNYISANMQTFGSPSLQGLASPHFKRESQLKDEFDIGELLQSVGDSLGGVAADADVDLVLHHGDAIKHMGVRGDECGISYALSHIIHQVLITTRSGDSMEIGLSITGQPLAGDGSDQPSTSSSSSSSGSSTSADSPALDAEGPVVCTFDIAHKFASSSTVEASSRDSHPIEQGQTHSNRQVPQFETTILRRLLKHIDGTLRPSLQPRQFPNGYRCELAVTLERGPSLSVIHQRTPPVEEDISRQLFPGIRLAREPSIDELTSFAETLRGKRVAFHASSQGSFAHYLTRYLTTWGMDISHVPTDGLEEKDPAEDAHVQSVYGSLVSSPGLGIGIPSGENVPPIIDSASDVPSEGKQPSGDASLSFVIIDDDLIALRCRLLQHRAETVPNLYIHSRKRPSLATHHRPRSSPSIRNTLLGASAHQQFSPPSAFSPVPIVHFTSLANYKLVKDAIQAVIFSVGSSLSLPEIIVIPKPAGPRRILTALHTAVHKPIVDPFFSPIATSPMSPNSTTSSLTARKSASSANLHTGSRSGAERQVRSGSDSVTTIPLSSPLSIPEGLEYFSDAAVKKLGGNAASGLVIQSPDGRPAGIFFQPQSRTSSSRTDTTATLMERERAPRLPSERTSRRSSSAWNPGAGSKPDQAQLSGDVAVKSPSIKSPLVAPLDKLLPSPPRVDRPHFSDQTELLRSCKGKGRATTDHEESSHALSSIAWREATQNLAKQPLTPTTLLGSNVDSGADLPLTHSSIIDPVLPPQVRKPSNPGHEPPGSRSPTSPTSPDAKKPVARRATLGAKSPVAPIAMKKSKTVGNNIVPPISVLIVEDNAINQTILSTFMRKNKIKYEVAWNGREAVEKWRNGNFHIILMDIQMPVMDGIEATKEIRRIEKAENISHFPPSPGESPRRSTETLDSRSSSATSTPFRSQVIIVALTASSLQSDRVAALAAGCNDFLTKPVTKLNDKIIEWGSIKALQMWAELRPDMAKNISHDQAIQAQAVANRLHVPPGSARGSPFGSPLKGAHIPLPVETEPQGAKEMTVTRTSRRTLPDQVRTARRSSDKGSSSSDSSPERWPASSDEETTQDPITEPPAIIETPVRPTIELPELEPTEITGEEALLGFFEESKQQAQLTRPTLLGQRAMSSVTSSTSIASVLHDTPCVGDKRSNGHTAANSSTEIASHDASGEKGDPPPH